MKEHNTKHAHFNGKDAVEHVAEAQAKGIISVSEIHGTEIPGHLSACTDAVRETAVATTLLWLFLRFIQFPVEQVPLALLIFGVGWFLWKAGRSAWLGWSRLERLHRILTQEKWEIEHNRAQEREELVALYQAKGFEGKLLEDVIDVLMSDGDRLLRVMVEEELGLSLHTTEHPLKQGAWAAIGTTIGWSVCIMGLIIWPNYGMVIAAMISIGCSAALTAKLTQNKIVDAIVWNLGLATLSIGSAFFLFDYFKAGR